MTRIRFNGMAAATRRAARTTVLVNMLTAGLAAMLAAVLTTASLSANAAYPDKSLNYIVPFGPGGESDIAARLQEPAFRRFTGQGLAIQYKPGAGGAAAWAQLNSMTADGYTVMGTNLPHLILQPLEKNVGYQTDDIDTVFWFQFTPDALLVPANSPIKTLKEFIAAAKKAPGAVTLSGSGTNSSNQLAKQQFDKMAVIKTTYIPFAGTGPSNAALLGNQVNGSWGYTTVQLQLGSQVRCLAVALEKRHPKLPDCPTFKEEGYDLVGGAYRGVAVPKSTPPEIKKVLAEDLAKVNADPDFIKKMEDNGFALINIGPDKMAAFNAEMRQRYGELAKEMGIVKK